MQNNISVILGKKGSGKSTLAKKLIKANKRKHLIIWDFLNEYGEFGVIVKSPKKLLQLSSETTHQKKVFVCQEFDIKKDFDFLCYFVKLLEDVLFVVEEVDFVCSPAYISKDFSSLFRYGRHWKVDIIAISRRPAEMNRLTTSQVDRVYCFKFNEPRDLRYLVEYAQFDINKIQSLKKYEYVYKEF